MRSRKRARGGFTLIEVIIALLVSGIVLLGARLLLSGLGDAAHRITARSREATSQVNGEAVLRALVGRLEVGTTESAPFSGDPTETHFTTWCEVPAGWEERCGVTLAIEQVDSTSALIARLPIQGRVVLERGFRTGAFRYLNSPASGGQWFRSWGTGITAPLALGVILDTDTLIVRIGERG